MPFNERKENNHKVFANKKARKVVDFIFCTSREDAANWAPNNVPDSTTNVVIPSGKANYPVVNSNAVCYTLRVDSGATFTINPGFDLTIVGK